MANLASTYQNQGRWNEAEQPQLQVIDTRKKLLGAEHPKTLTSMSNLASTYGKQGRWNEVEQLEVQVMDMKKKLLGAEHPYTLTSMANLACVKYPYFT
jgi:Tetratricopeptide repeat